MYYFHSEYSNKRNEIGMGHKIFIDGQEGTTGLRIVERLKDRTDIELLKIDESLRKDVNERKRLINASDITFLCLPDAAAAEAVSLAENENVRIIDASTAHRTDPDWAYGFPELSAAHRERIRTSKRVANPGCYASGFIACVYPLTAAGIMAKDYPVTCHAVSGYSGAGKKGIAQYESPDRDPQLDSPRQYALTQAHKHIKEMMTVSGLTELPVFTPIVDDYYNGMVVSVPLHMRTLEKKLTLSELRDVYAAHYEGQRFVRVMPLCGEGVLADGFIAANTLKDTNDMQIFVCGNDDRAVISARFDNLGKGASGAAVQSMNIMMGVDEAVGLV